MRAWIARGGNRGSTRRMRFPSIMCETGGWGATDGAGGGAQNGIDDGADTARIAGSVVDAERCWINWRRSSGFGQLTHYNRNFSRGKQMDPDQVTLRGRRRCGLRRRRLQRGWRSGRQQRSQRCQLRQPLGVEKRQQKQAAYGQRLQGKRNQSRPATT